MMTAAWSKGVLVVASGAEGHCQYIEHSMNGMLGDIEGMNGFTKNLRKVLEDKDLHTRLIAGGSRTYESQFSEEIFVPKLLTTYEEIACRDITA